MVVLLICVYILFVAPCFEGCEREIMDELKFARGITFPGGKDFVSASRGVWTIVRSSTPPTNELKCVIEVVDAKRKRTDVHLMYSKATLIESYNITNIPGGIKSKWMDSFDYFTYFVFEKGNVAAGFGCYDKSLFPGNFVILVRNYARVKDKPNYKALLSEAEAALKRLTKRRLYTYPTDCPKAI